MYGELRIANPNMDLLVRGTQVRSTRSLASESNESTFHRIDEIPHPGAIDEDYESSVKRPTTVLAAAATLKNLLGCSPELRSRIAGNGGVRVLLMLLSYESARALRRKVREP